MAACLWDTQKNRAKVESPHKLPQEGYLRRESSTDLRRRWKMGGDRQLFEGHLKNQDLGLKPQRLPEEGKLSR